MLDRLNFIFRETCLQMDCELLEFGGEDDHVHILVNVHPKISVSILVGKLKGKSSYYLRREFWDRIKGKLWGNNFWSPSYCVVSCGGATLDVIKAFIENQNAPASEKQERQSRAIAKSTRGLA